MKQPGFAPAKWTSRWRRRDACAVDAPSAASGPEKLLRILRCEKMVHVNTPREMTASPGHPAVTVYFSWIGDSRAKGGGWRRWLFYFLFGGSRGSGRDATAITTFFMTLVESHDDALSPSAALRRTAEQIPPMSSHLTGLSTVMVAGF